MKVELIEGATYGGIDTSRFKLDVQRKMEGRKVLIKRIYKRFGASERSFVCVFLANTKRAKDYEHTFNEYEKLADLLFKCENQNQEDI